MSTTEAKTDSYNLEQITLLKKWSRLIIIIIYSEKETLKYDLYNSD